MARNTTTATNTELTKTGADPQRLALLAKAELTSGDLNLWAGVGDIVWNGDTYTGAGDLLAVSEIEETEEIRAAGVTVTLSGLTTEILSVALSEDYQGRPLTIYLAFFDAAGAIIADPVTVFSGRLDVMRLDASAETFNITASAENELISLERPIQRRYTPEDQKEIYSGDTFFDFNAVLQDQEIKLGRN